MKANRQDDPIPTISSAFESQQQFHFSSVTMNPALNCDTPPPPPPKPTSHEASRRGTPQLNPSLPGTPQSLHERPYGADATMHRYPPATNLNPTGTSLPRPPTVEEGWLPENVKEKSYVPTLLSLRPHRGFENNKDLIFLYLQNGRPTNDPQRPEFDLRASKSTSIPRRTSRVPAVTTKV